jgi:enoyl reductase-like protein
MSTRHEVRDDDEVHFPDISITTSGEVLRRLVEDMYGLTVDQYINHAQFGQKVRQCMHDVEAGKR